MGSLIIALSPWGSLVAQCFDRAESRRAVRGIKTEEQTDADRDAECQKDGWGRDHGRRQGGDRDGEYPRQAEANQDAERAAQAREEHRLDQELQQDVLAAGADRLSDTDLAGPL